MTSESTLAAPELIEAEPEDAAFDEAVLTVEDLTVDFPIPDGVAQAVRGVSYRLRPGEVLGLVGESGSGKSVTSLAVMGLLPRTARVSGPVRFRRQKLTRTRRPAAASAPAARSS